MDDFIFDLQRFNDNETILGENPLVLTFGDNVTRSITSENSTIKATILSNDAGTETVGAVISLSNAGDNFFVNDKDGRKFQYKLTSLGEDGIIITINSGAAASIDAIDKGDVFTVGDTVNSNSISTVKVSMFDNGLLVGDGFIKNNSVQSITLEGAALNSPTSDLHKVLEVDNKTLNITAASDVSSISYAMDTDITDGSPTIYAEIKPSNSNYKYRISSLEGAASLSTINISANDVLTLGVEFSTAFAGDNDSTPTIIASNTKLHVDKATDSFVLSGGSNKEISLSTEASEVSLISGSVITANSKQTIKTSDYSISSYAGGKDGIIIYGDGTNATLGDIDVGESFVIANGSSTETYTKTKLGLVKNGDDSLRPLVVGSTWLTDAVLPVASIVAATTKAYDSTFLDATKQITVSSSATAGIPTLIAYGNTALATLNGSGSTYTLTADSSYTSPSALNLDKWGGIKLSSSGQSITFNKTQFIGDSPLMIDNGSAVYGFMAYTGSELKVGSSTNLNNTAYKKIYLKSGTVIANQNNDLKGQIFVLGTSNVEFTRARRAWTLNADSNTGVTLSHSSSEGKTDNDRDVKIGQGTFNNTSPANISATVDTAGNTYVKSSRPFTLTSANDINDTLLCNTGGAIFVYGKEGSGVSVSVEDLTSDATFSTTKGGTTTSYTYQSSNGALILGTKGNSGLKIFSKTDSNYDETKKIFALDPDNFKDYHKAVSGNVTISNDYDKSDERLIISATVNGSGAVTSVDSDIVYGGVTKTSSGYEINRNTSSATVTNTISSVFIDSTAATVPVNFIGNFANTTVTVGSVAFKILDNDSDSNFTVSSGEIGVKDNNVAVTEVKGTKNINLISGTILTNDSAQTITAGTYNISSDSTNTDGITVAQSVSGSGSNRSTVQVIGDVDYGESFYIGGTKYTRGPLGITFGEGGTGGQYNVTPVGANSDIYDTEYAVDIPITQITSGIKRVLYGSESNIYKGDTSKYVFYVGGSSHSVPAMLVNDPSSATISYGNLETVSGGYSLVSNDNTWENLDIISLISGNETINSSFTTSNSSEHVTIMTEGGVSFLVNDTTSDGVFTVNATVENPIIGGATDLTLLNGKITAVPTISTADSVTTYNQTINLGTSTVPPVLQVATNTRVGYSDSTATITGTYASVTGIGTGFTLNSVPYSIIGGDGMDFLVDDSGDVTITKLKKAATVNADAFYYNGKYYSIRSAGFVRGNTVGLGNKLWNKDNSHILAGGSVAISDINSDYDANWINIAEIDKDTRVASIPADLNGSLVYVDLNYVNNYGKITGSNSAYSLAKDNATVAIKNIYIPTTLSDLSLSIERGFNNITIDSQYATVAVPTVSGDYQVFLNDSAMSLSGGVENTSLISGALISDSNLKVSVLDKVVQALEDSTITLTASSTNSSVALDVGESFNLGTSSYTLGALGLTKDTSILLSGEEDGRNTLAISDVTNTANYFNMLALEGNAITISSNTNDKTLVVDKSPIPKTAYASIGSSVSKNFALSEIENADSISSVYIGTGNISISTDFDTSVKLSNALSNFPVTVNVNSDYYKAKSSSDFVIKSGDSANKSYLLSGSVILDTNISAVSTSLNAVSVGSGTITVAADNSNPVTITGLNDGDIFTVDEDNTPYSVKSTGLLSGYKIWKYDNYTSAGVELSGASGLTLDSNWNYFVNISDNILSIPVSNDDEEYPTDLSQWIILSEDLQTNYGTLISSSGGYSIANSNTAWGGTDTISINETTVSLPTAFLEKNIKGVSSGAAFKVGSASDIFVISDGDDGATIANAIRITQSSGIIALPQGFEQTVVAAGTSSTYRVASDPDNEGNGITVIIKDGVASIGALSIENEQDSFKIGGTSYQMLSNGSIWKTGNQFWLGKISENGAVGIDDLQDNSNWANAIKITDKIFKIPSAIGSLSVGFLMNEDNRTEIYGKLTASGSSYTLDGSNVNATLTGIELDDYAQVSLTSGNKKYVNIPITVSGTTFAVTDAESGFTVDYSKDSLGTDATGVSLISGAWDLSDKAQTLTADGQVIQVGESSTVTANIISGGVDVTGLDVAGEIVTINSNTYQLNSSDGGGIGVSLTSDSVATVKEISDDDNFAVNKDTFIKRSAGFIKKNTNNYLWINSADVTGGVAVASLNGSDTVNTWAAVATVDGGAITINRSSTTKVFIDSVDSLNSIYGALTKNSNTSYTLSDKIGAVTVNDTPTSIAIESVIAGLSGYYTNVPIYAKGASFAVQSLTSASELFTVDATKTNATLDNVAQVSLGSGTLANLTSATTVNTSDQTIAVASSSTINIGLSGSVITFSALDDGEGFTLSGDDSSVAYVYKDVGIVRDNSELYVDDSLGGTITSDSLAGVNYQEMFASGSGSMLTLQSQAKGVFVDNAGDSVSKVYALQSYDADNKLYTLTNKTTEDFVVNAQTLASGAGISAPFETQIITPETGTFTVNDKSYVAVSALTIDTTADSSTLNKGTAALALGASVALTATVIADDGDTISVTGGDGIQVSAATDSYTLEELNKGDTFTIGGISYTMQNANYLFRTINGATQLCKTSVTGGAISSTIFGSSDSWKNFIPLERVDGKYTLNLSSSSIDDGIVVSSDLNTVYADLDVTGNSFVLNEIDGADATGISQVSLDSDTSTLIADFATTVKTTSGTGTYTVNYKSYTAKNSALEIVTDADNSSITSGVITLSNSDSITTSSNHTVSGTVAELDVAKMSFTPTTGNNFTVDGAAYELNSVGLTKTESNNSYLWTRSSTSSFVLPASDNFWSAMMTLNKDNTTLNLKEGVSASSVVVLDNGRTKRMALLNYASSDNAYTVTSEGGNSIAIIQLGDSTDSILGLTVGFESNVETGNGLYKINGTNYKGNALTITTDDNSSALYDGTVSLNAGTVYNSISDDNNSYEVTGGDGITATATKATISSLGGLNKGDTFAIGGNSYYKVLDSETLVQTDSSGGAATKLYTGFITSGALNTADIISTNFVDFINLGASGALDLTQIHGASGWSGIVLGANEDGDYTVRIAQVSYDGEGYSLTTTERGKSSSLASVSLEEVRTFTTSIATTVNAAEGNTYTINGKPFTAQSDLKIAAAENSTVATLINGAVTLGENGEVTTRRISSSGAQTDEVIKTTSGTTTVTVDETAGTVTISGLAPGEKFTFNSVEYTMTPIGLQNGSLLNPYVVTNGNSIVTTDLDLSDADKWLATYQATGGALTLTTSTPSNVFVVDMTSSSQAVKYGTLRKSGDVYTLTQDDSDTKLTSIALNGVRATLGAKASDVDITTNSSTTFNVTATGNFTVNAASGGNPVVSDVSNVSGISLSVGTIIAPLNIPVTASGYAIKATNGDMNISIVNGAAQISELEKDDTFTVDDTTNYKVVDIGLLDVTNQQLRTEVEDTYTIGEAFTRIIAVDENTTNLNLSSETKSANVYDSISAPRTQLGTLTINKGVKNLAAVGSGATAMQSVDIAAGDNLNVSFDTRVNSAAGTVTVNGNTYAGTTALAIDSDGTTSTLYAGTITLDIATPSATDSNKNTLAREVGTFTATAADGRFTTLTGLDNAESFTYVGDTYLQNPLGLINRTDNVICADILAGATINLVNLNSAAWNNFTTPVDGVLNISELDSNYIVYDDATNPTTRYATLTVADGKKTLTGETVAAEVISEVVIAAGDDLTVDFVTQVDSPIGSVTVNGNTYAGTTELLIDSDGTTSTLYDGTITLDETNSTATDSSGNSLARASGSFTATAVEGAFTVINGLDNTESFTYGGATYIQSAQGLRNGALICRALTGTTIDLSKLGGTWDNILAPVNGVLDISNFSGNAYVYNSATNPTAQLAILTTADGVKTLTNSNNAAGSISAVNIAAGDKLAVDFVTQINSPIGSVTVNNKDYVGTTALVITSDGATSTLTEGTITLADNGNTVETTGGTEITYTTDGGDGLTIAVDNSGESEAVTFSELTTGDTFTIGEGAYKVSAVAPMNPSGELWTGGDYANGITLAQINDASNWTPMIAAPDAALSVDAETLTDGGEVIVVDNVDDPTAIYCDLTKSGEAYTLTRPTTANADLTSIAVDGVAIEIAPNYAGVDFTANDSAFSDVTLADAEKSFILDATNTPSLSDNVSSLTLTAGTIDAAVNQVVTTGNNVITPTAINGDMVIGTETISGIVQGDAFTLNDKAYKMLNTGLFNDTDNKLVTSGITDGTLTISDIVETQLLAISNGNLNLSNAAAGNTLVVDTVESPANVYGALNKNGNTYTLNKRSDGITSITLPNDTSTLTTDIATTVNAPSSSNTYTVNSKVYKANSSALTIASDGTTSTLTNGTISLTDNNDTVTTTSGSIVTYTTDGDGMTLAVTSDGITFSGLTTGDTFTIGEGAYKVSAVAPINPSGELWTGGDYSEGITLAQINDASNWTPILAAPSAALSIDAETLSDGGEVIVVDNVDDPTAIYGDLTKSGDAYTLTRPTTANADLTSIAVDGVAIEIAPNYAGVDFTANDSAFSDVTLADAEKSFILDATNTPSLSDNVSSLTLTAGTIDAAVNQIVTTGNNVITPTAINGDMVIGTETISGIVQGDAFTLNDKAYKMLNTGLFNDTDNKLVTSGITDGTLTISDIVETQLLAISNGELNLSNAAAGNTLIVDTVESPANVYGSLNKNSNTYTLDKRSDGITSITLPNDTSTLTTDIAATVNAPSSSNTYTVNSKVYKANNSALTIASDGTTSTLTNGTISLTDNEDTVTTTSGSTITYTTDGDGMTLVVTSSGITFSGLTTGDTFTIGEGAYKVSAVAPMNPAGELWTGGDYANGITLAQINDASNWTPILAAPDAALSINAETLSDGGEVIVVDNVDAPTAIYGDLTKSSDAYTLTRPTTANADLTSINVDGVAIEIAPNYAGVTFTANDSAFSDVTLADAEKSFTLDATNTPSLSDNVSSLTLTAGTIDASVNQIVTTGNNVITPTAINGGMIIGTATISGIVQGDAFTLNDKAYKMLNTGLFNDTDNKLVTSGITDGTLTISDIVETQLLAISNGELNLSNAAAGNSLVVDTVESPANVYGSLNKNGNTYTLNKRSDGITSITLPAETSTLTTDIAATVNAPSSSNTYTVNIKVYKANNSALTIASDGRTSTLTDGTISLTDNNDTVTTTSGSTVTYTTDGDGMTVTAANNSVTLNGLTASDTFTVGDNAYRVSQLGFHNDANYLWTSSTDYKDGVTVAEINNADNWTRTVIADNDSLSVDDKTLSDDVTAIVIDSATAATKSLGTLSRTGDTYTLTRDATNKLSAIAVDNTKLAIDNQLADVLVTADGATFTVTANAPYTVDATGNTVAISDDATAIEISTGTITATTNQTITATPDSGATSVIGQNNGTFNIGGETFAVADNVGSITFGMTNGAADYVRNLEENANVTIDGRTYTAPQDNSTLLFNDADGWYFEGYVPTRYNITIDSNGNVIVDAGVKFTDVVASGQTLPEDGTIKLAVDVNTIPINVTNAGTTAINLNDKDNNPLAENLGAVENVTFDSAGVMVENTSDVAGAVFTIDTGQSFETETATITASADDCAVGVGTNGTSLSVDKAATIDAPSDTALTLGSARYTVNGVYFTSGGTAQASLTSDGVKFDLVNSDVITYNRTNFDGTGNATAEFDKDRGISLTSGASVDGATGKSFNIAGTVTLDANTIDAATATDVTAKSSGYAVANDDVTVTGDDDGYKVNISGGQINGLENIGSESGVTIGGLSNGTIKTDKVGAFTVADKTFIAVGDASVTYGIENGTLTSASDVASVITGDFSDGLTVNNGKLQVTGDNVSLDVSRNSNRKIDGFNDKATLTTADNVIKIEPTGAGEFTFGDHVFKVDDATIAFNLRNSSVIGVDSLENGNLIISQDEHNFIVNAESIDLDEIDSPVTLEIADSGIHSVYGLHSGMDGLDIATVFGVSAATINNKYFEIAGGTLDAIVVDSIPASLYGLESDMTINSAPSVAIRTTENGTFTFGNDVFNINDTVDGVVVFETDENTHVINIGEFEGEVFGDLKDTALNDKTFSTSSDKVTVISDGTDIISLQGLSSGDSISGSLSNATYVMPEGTLNVNDRGYILAGDDDGVSMTGDGLVVVGLDKDASLTVTKGGAYSVNDQDFKAKDGDTFIAGRDYVYIADPNNKPITEKTKIDDIIENLLGKQGKGTVSLSGDSAARAIASGNLDSPMALTLDSDISNADFSNSNNTKRVTLLGGDQNIKFNDEGGNAAYVDKTAKGKKNIELGNGGDVAVNDAPNAKVSIKAGTGADTIVNRNGAKSTVDVKNNGDTTIVPTSGKVTLQNYSNDNNAKIRTFEYSDLTTAIKSNEVKFGDGVMTLGDAVIVFDPNASAVGGTFANLVDYSGDNQRVGFTHTDGGVLNASTSSDNLILKGNYAESSSDTTKTGASTLISGRGNDTILAGGDDYIDAGAGENQIYITDKNLAGGEGVTILLAGKGKNIVHSFNGGFDGGDAIKVDDISAVKFIFDENGLVMRSGRARITFDSLEPADDLVSYSDADVAAPYEIQISDGTNEYNAAVAQEGKDIGVHDSNEANLFYGDNTGLNFSEYTGEVEVNLNQGTGSLDGSAAFFYNINKLQAGSGNSSLIGKAGAKNTLIAGTGNTSMWSAAGRDSMVGNASDEKDGSTMFYYLAGDGRDTITNFSFMTSADGYNADIINITTDNAVTDVYLKGDNVVMQINNSPEDYLTLVNAKGKDFKINNLIAKVDDNNIEFDGIANCYVADRKNSTMSIGADVGNAQIWLDDRATGQHGIYYLGDIKYLDASKATGNDTLVGNDLDNIIYGGAGKNSIWGGFGDSNDTLVGGSGQNTFFFGMQNGKDIATSTKDGDVVDLTTIGLEQIRATTITGGGAKLELTDGSSLEIQGTANVEYRLNDGSRYAADHSSGQWIKK